jgi:tRNA (cmo5U34)-methyltransferase
VRGVGIDLSQPMLTAARKRLTNDQRIEPVEHDLAEPLPDHGRFDAVASSRASRGSDGAQR